MKTTPFAAKVAVCAIAVPGKCLVHVADRLNLTSVILRSKRVVDRRRKSGFRLVISATVKSCWLFVDGSRTTVRTSGNTWRAELDGLYEAFEDYRKTGKPRK